MAAHRPSNGPPARRRLQINLRLRRSDHELLQQLTAATGLPAAQVVRMLLRQGAKRLVLEEKARRRDEESWRRYLQEEGTRWRPPPQE